MWFYLTYWILALLKPLAEVQPKQTNHQVHLLNARSDLSASQKHPQIVAIFNEDGNFVDKRMQITVHTLIFCEFELILFAMIANKVSFCKAGVVATKCASISRAAHIPEQTLKSNKHKQYSPRNMLCVLCTYEIKCMHVARFSLPLCLSAT